MKVSSVRGRSSTSGEDQGEAPPDTGVAWRAFTVPERACAVPVVHGGCRLVLIFCEKKILLAGWFILSEQADDSRDMQSIPSCATARCARSVVRSPPLFCVDCTPPCFVWYRYKSERGPWSRHGNGYFTSKLPISAQLAPSSHQYIVRLSTLRLVFSSLAIADPYKTR